MLESPIIQHHIKTIDEDITRDATLLFKRERSGHVGYLCYGSPVDALDNVRGAEAWAQACKEEGYYLKREDDHLLQSVIQRLPTYNIKARTFIDLGPGDENALRTKTLPLLRCINAQRYIAVDMTQEYADAAASHVSKALETKAETVVANFMEQELPFHKNRAFLFFGGSTIGNISVDIRIKDPTLALSAQLAKFRDSIDQNGYLLVGFDANQEKNSLQGAFSARGIDRMVEDIIWRIARDTDIELDASAFKYHGEWIAAEHRIAHCVKATRNCIIRLRHGTVNVAKGQIFHLMSSYKFPVDMMKKAALNAGWKTKMIWSETDRCHYALFEAI